MEIQRILFEPPKGASKRSTKEPLIFYPSLARALGGLEAAIFLTAAIDWTEQDTDGWFKKTRHQWEQRTTLTRSQQERIRADLRRAGLLDEERRGIPAQLWYKVNLLAVEKLHREQFEREQKR